MVGFFLTVIGEQKNNFSDESKLEPITSYNLKFVVKMLLKYYVLNTSHKIPHLPKTYHFFGVPCHRVLIHQQWLNLFQRFSALLYSHRALQVKY